MGESPVTPPTELPAAGHRVVGPPTDGPVSPIREGEPHPPSPATDTEASPLGGTEGDLAYNERDTFMMLVCNPCGYVQWFYLSDNPEQHLAHFSAEHAEHQV